MEPVESLTDPRVITLLTTEHWSILSARSLAYNEAFVRAGMFLTFLSMSFVALGLLSQATGFGGDFLVIAAMILAFDLVIGLTTYGRILGANVDDLRAVHGMARIRHGYTQIAPIVARYSTSPIHDDIPSVVMTYGPSTSAFGTILYGLTTSAGMIGLIVSMIAGVLGAVVGLLIGAGGGFAVWLGVAVAVIVFAALLAWAMLGVPRAQATLDALFPAPQEPAAVASD
jgi:hypothetical protein